MITSYTVILTPSAARNIATDATISTDGLPSFAVLAASGYTHVPRTQPPPLQLRHGAKSVVPLADRMIGNLQRWLVGTHHGVSRGQLQGYRDEFVCRANRRREPRAAFQTLLGLGSSRGPTAYAQIQHARDRKRLRSAETSG
ncbi:MAG: hypothetical protein OJF50_002991 [Nitrospira sp.]|jgi:hypothetical protein|nr:hypothetical protein [Nitrospira sp.]